MTIEEQYRVAKQRLTRALPHSYIWWELWTAPRRAR